MEDTTCTKTLIPDQSNREHLWHKLIQDHHVFTGWKHDENLNVDYTARIIATLRRHASLLNASRHLDEEEDFRTILLDSRFHMPGHVSQYAMTFWYRLHRQRVFWQAFMSLVRKGYVDMEGIKMPVQSLWEYRAPLRWFAIMVVRGLRCYDLRVLFKYLESTEILGRLGENAFKEAWDGRLLARGCTSKTPMLRGGETESFGFILPHEIHPHQLVDSEAVNRCIEGRFEAEESLLRKFFRVRSENAYL